MQAKDTVVQEVHAIQNETELGEEPDNLQASKSNNQPTDGKQTGFESKQITQEEETKSE